MEKDVRHVEERYARLRRRHGRVEGKRGHPPLPQGKREVSQDYAHQDRAGKVWWAGSAGAYIRTKNYQQVRSEFRGVRYIC